MSYDREIEERKADLMEGLVENIKWQNAMMAELALEMRQMQLVMMCAEGELPEVADREKVMQRAESFRYQWETEYHPQVRR